MAKPKIRDVVIVLPGIIGSVLQKQGHLKEAVVEYKKVVELNSNRHAVEEARKRLSRFVRKPRRRDSPPKE